jgi:hypothetical protein
VLVRIADVRGREVARIPGIATPGGQRLVWNGVTGSGEIAPAGVYFASLVVGDSRLQRKFVRIAQ